MEGPPGEMLGLSGEATQEMVLLDRQSGTALTQKHLSMRSSLFSISVTLWGPGFL